MDNEQLERAINNIGDDVDNLSQVVGTALWAESSKSLVNRVEQIESRVIDLEYGARQRTTLIYTSIFIGILNLLAVAGLYLQ